jgi:hypothetical protein
MRLGEIRTFGSFPVMLSAPGTLTQVLFSGPAKVNFNTTTEEDVYTSWWELVTIYAKVQTILASINIVDGQSKPYQILMIAYDRTHISFYGLYGSTSAPPSGNVNPFPLPALGVSGVAGVIDPCEPFVCLYVRGDKPWWGQSGSLLDY